MFILLFLIDKYNYFIYNLQFDVLICVYIVENVIKLSNIYIMLPIFLVRTLKIYFFSQKVSKKYFYYILSMVIYYLWVIYGPYIIYGHLIVQWISEAWYLPITNIFSLPKFLVTTLFFSFLTNLPLLKQLVLNP